jgi:hypothetical protein
LLISFGTLRALPIATCLLLGCSGNGGSGLDPSGKFASLAELLANSNVQKAIQALPAGDGIGAGAYYQGSTPSDFTGTWSTDVAGGSLGVFTGFGSVGMGTQGKFGTTMTFDVVGPGRVDVPTAVSQRDIATRAGRFVVGTGDQITVFLQLNVTCVADNEHIRIVAIDRFVHSPAARVQDV